MPMEHHSHVDLLVVLQQEDQFGHMSLVIIVNIGRPESKMTFIWSGASVDLFIIYIIDEAS